jgi:hypothetical protein
VYAPDSAKRLLGMFIWLEEKLESSHHKAIESG